MKLFLDALLEDVPPIPLAAQMGSKISQSFAQFCNTLVCALAESPLVNPIPLLSIVLVLLQKS
jgi:hypothetical protein